MFEHAIQGLNAILERTPWAGELAGILPLSALIDFIDLPPQLHIYQLVGGVPFWSWPLTPAASRLLLSAGNVSEPQGPCYLDRYGNSVSLLGLDGRYGDQYPLSSPETIRLCVGSQIAHPIDNEHKNMQRRDNRLQNLEIIHVSRGRKCMPPDPSSSWLTYLMSSLRAASTQYLATTTLGWFLLLSMIAMSVILQTYLALAFLIIVPLTGCVIALLHGHRPRQLLVETTSPYSRLVLVAEHMNADSWSVFYGESTIVNSLLNRHLKSTVGDSSKRYSPLLRLILRILIVGQWAIAIGAAATKDWNSYFLSFWVVFCIFSNAYLIPPPNMANDWLDLVAGIRMERYQTCLSTRRALLNTVMALNPDTFALPRDAAQEDRTKLDPGALKWIDPILARGSARTLWEEATMKALNEFSSGFPVEGLESYEDSKSGFPSSEWKEKYVQNYWARYVAEGIYMASKIRQEADLPGRKVRGNEPASLVA